MEVPVTYYMPKELLLICITTAYSLNKHATASFLDRETAQIQRSHHQIRAHIENSKSTVPLLSPLLSLAKSMSVEEVA